MNKYGAFEIWCIKRLLKIPWTPRITTQEVLNNNGKKDGRHTRRGEKKLSWMQNIRNWTALRLEQVTKKTQNREAWAAVIAKPSLKMVQEEEDWNGINLSPLLNSSSVANVYYSRGTLSCDSILRINIVSCWANIFSPCLKNSLVMSFGPVFILFLGFYHRYLIYREVTVYHYFLSI